MYTFWAITIQILLLQNLVIRFWHFRYLSEGVSQNLPVMKQHFDLEIFFLAVGCRPESGHVFDPIGLDPDQPEHRKRK